jgi:hypothetical protein
MQIFYFPLFLNSKGYIQQGYIQQGYIQQGYNI